MNLRCINYHQCISHSMTSERTAIPAIKTLWIETLPQCAAADVSVGWIGTLLAAGSHIWTICTRRPVSRASEH